MNRTAAFSDSEEAPGPAGRAQPLYRRAFEILAARILTGEMEPGAELRESRVAEDFGISRAPVRQALSLLDAHGLVAREAGGAGYRVAPDAPTRPPPPGVDLSRAGPSRLSSTASWEQIYARVEAEITARIAFGAWRVNEAEIGRSFGVSRTVARDVVGRLQQRGLVQKDDSSRWFAPALTPGHIGELYELRWVLEPVALTLAAPRIGEAEVAAVRDRLVHALAADPPAQGAELDRLEEDLHVGLLGHCPNGAILSAIEQAQSLLIAHRFLYRSTTALFLTEPFLEEHLGVVDLLMQRDVAGAAGRLETHLRRSLERAVARVEHVSGNFRPGALPYLDPL